MTQSSRTKTAIITGVTGQDGAYLSEFLLQKGYRVVGLIPSLHEANLYRLKYLNLLDSIELWNCELNDLAQVLKIISSVEPDEIYNLAAQSSVSLSFQQPFDTLTFNISSVLSILEAIRVINPAIRFYQASSSEMFGKVDSLPIDEQMKFYPLSPYAVSKAAAHYIAVNYRESYNLFTSCGILFNHESYLRGENFFIKKLLHGALDIVHGKREHLEFGNLELKRDFGWSEKYIEAMWLMLQHHQPDDFIICSGTSLRLRDIVEYVFCKLQIPVEKIRINPNLFRPAEITDSYGTSDKAQSVLQWRYNLTFYEVLDKLIAEERQNYCDRQ